MTNKTTITTGSIIAVILGCILAIEGGYVNNPNDPGGETKYGITKSTARSYGYTGAIKDLPVDLAKRIYKDWYITKPQLDKIINLSPAIGHKVIDAGVNVGTKRSVKWLQVSLNILSKNGTDYDRISEDGSIGPKTLYAFQTLQAKRGKAQSCELLMKLIDMQQSKHYVDINNPTFIIGWLTNRIENIPLSYCSDYRVTSDMLFESTTR